jgi:signal transduction histidine kinase
MKTAFRVLALLLLIYSPDNPASGSEPYAVKGVIDLRQTATDNFTVKLSGEWSFYWKKLLKPADFLSDELKPDFFGVVPSYWTSYPSGDVKITSMGFATYKLIMLLPQGYRNSLGFNLPVFDSSYEIYVDGKLMGGNGIPGKTEAETTPGYERVFFRYNPVRDSVQIIINVSNFNHRRGGFWLPMRTGTFSEVQKKYAAGWARDWASISFLIGFSFLFFFFFIFYTRDSSMGFFSLATTGLALRPLFTSNFMIHNIMDMTWVWIVRWEYIGLYIILTGWYWFAAILYPAKVFRWITWTITLIFALAAVLTLFLPVRVFSYMTFIIYPLLIVLIVYSLTRSIKGIIRKNYVDYIYFLTFAILTFAAINDVRISLGRSAVFSGYILTYTIILFVFIQAVLLLHKWYKAFSEKEKLQNDLEFMNRNLEILVKERTQEINSRREEIENQNIKIAIQNKKLSETIQLKNKIFSVIAHDLRSPVVNILYMLNLLKEEEFRDKYDSFADASIQYSQQVINLLENMLVWGRGQEDKIKYSPARNDFADIILTNMSIFKETADKKDIIVNFTQIGNSKAWFDKDLMDIIIRNLLSNAIKYTPRGGRISILLKDKTLSGEGISLKICDNGVGIPAVKQKYLFTETEIESTPGTENERGTGIGLKLCFELVTINNGTIVVESSEGEGTCFTITLAG